MEDFIPLQPKEAFSFRRFLGAVNQAGKEFGFDEIAGDPYNPDDECDWLEVFREGLTPAQAVARAVGQAS